MLGEEQFNKYKTYPNLRFVTSVAGITYNPKVSGTNGMSNKTLCFASAKDKNFNLDKKINLFIKGQKESAFLAFKNAQKVVEILTLSSRMYSVANKYCGLKYCDDSCFSFYRNEA